MDIFLKIQKENLQNSNYREKLDLFYCYFRFFLKKISNKIKKKIFF